LVTVGTLLFRWYEGWEIGSGTAWALVLLTVSSLLAVLVLFSELRAWVRSYKFFDEDWDPFKDWLPVPPSLKDWEDISPYEKWISEHSDTGDLKRRR
jgi:hypothetical protein